MFDSYSSDTNDSLHQFADSSLTGQIPNFTQSGGSNLIPGYANQAIAAARTQLQAIATDPDLIPILQTAFGEAFNLDTANSLFAHFANGDFSALPTVEILSDRVLPTANGAFSAATDRVYLNNRFIADNSANLDAITGVVLEEYGHAIDSLINFSDSPGDEGEIFAAIATGKNLSEAEISSLKAEDDTATILLNGQTIAIEQAFSGTLSGGQTLSGQLSSSDGNNPTRNSTYFDDYRLTGLTAGQQVQLDLSSTAFDSYLQLVNESTGQVIDSNDDYGGSTNSRLTFTPQTGVSYLARATSFNPSGIGAYSLKRNGAGSVVTITATPILGQNETGYGTLSTSDRNNPTRSGKYSDDFSLSGLTVGQQIQLDMGSMDFDSYLQLVNAGTGQVIDANDDRGDGTNNSRISFIPQAGVSYLARATSYNSGAVGNYTLRTTSTQPEMPVPTGAWRGQYFNNNSLSGSPTFTRTDSLINNDWAVGGPGNGLGNDNFSVRWEGNFNFDQGNYRFLNSVDDGMKVWVDGNLIHDTWNGRNAVDYSNLRSMTQGQHNIKVEYREITGLAVAKASWQKIPNVFKDPVNELQQWKTDVYRWSGGDKPSIEFYGAGLDNNSNAIGQINLGSNTRSDGKKGIIADWRSGAPNNDSRLPIDNFAIRAYTVADFDGSPYKFRVRADDGYMIFAKNQVSGQFYSISPNQWAQDYGAQREYTSTLPAGRYDLHFQQYEGGGDAYIDLSWDKIVVAPPAPIPTWEKPLSSPSYTVSSEFGNRTYWNGSKWVTDNHTGIDLSAPSGTPIEAARAGKVTFVGADQYGGKYIDIDHGGGLKTRYLHLSSFAVSVGNVVNENTKIGEVGKTGLATGNHLHFEVFEGGVRQNPRKYINF
jgi:murein DD-endopeptidase MepM/ murein hydrolase activator NlpD